MLKMWWKFDERHKLPDSGCLMNTKKNTDMKVHAEVNLKSKSRKQQEKNNILQTWAKIWLMFDIPLENTEQKSEAT